MHRPETKVAPKEARDARITPAQSNAQNLCRAKDFDTLFEEAVDRQKNMTPEERYEMFPFLKTMKGGTVDPAKGMQILEEMERQEAALPDGTD